MLRTMQHATFHYVGSLAMQCSSRSFTLGLNKRCKVSLPRYRHAGIFHYRSVPSTYTYKPEVAGKVPVVVNSVYNTFSAISRYK